jgi:hypothetical protein
MLTPSSLLKYEVCLDLALSLVAFGALQRTTFEA